MKTILSGIQPSNKLTLGNYVGALKNWVKLQNEYENIFLAVNLHAITVKQDPKILLEQTYRLIATYIAAGLDPEHPHNSMVIQSHVPEHTELAWVLNCHTYMGELNRMTQYKDKSAKQGANIPAGLFTYPVLMVGDILLYQTDLVPIGEDQKQHLELTRDVAIRMNNQYGALFKIPEVYIPPVGARIMSLQNPLEKMSKSDPDPNASIYLNDTDDQIIKKLKRAVTDSGSEIAYDDSKPGVKNLIEIQAAITGHTPAEIVSSYAGKMYGHLKVETGELLVKTIAPIRSRADELMKEKTYLDQILKKGAEKARLKAQTTLKRVYEALGLGSRH